MDQHCVILGNVNVNSPLLWDGTMTKSAPRLRPRQPGGGNRALYLGGAMGPVTNAGAIAQAHAETMVGCAITQLERPGAPVIYGNFLSSMSLRSGSPTFGTPEPAVGSLVVGQLARRAAVAAALCRVIHHVQTAGRAGHAGKCDVHALGHSLRGQLHPAFRRISGWAAVMSYEKFMLDADFCGALHSYLAGVVVDDNSLAMSAFQQVTPAGTIWAAPTPWPTTPRPSLIPPLPTTRPFETWAEAGQTDSAQRANTRWKTALADYQPPPMDVAVDEALKDYIQRKKSTMPDQWY